MLKFEKLFYCYCELYFITEKFVGNNKFAHVSRIINDLRFLKKLLSLLLERFI